MRISADNWDCTAGHTRSALMPGCGAAPQCPALISTRHAGDSAFLMLGMRQGRSVAAHVAAGDVARKRTPEG